MAQQNATDDATDELSNNDPRPAEMRSEMAEHFRRHESQYRSGAWSQIVYEDDKMVIVADDQGQELSDWCDEFSESVDRDELIDHFHRIAHDLVSEDDWVAIFATAFPLIFDKGVADDE